MVQPIERVMSTLNLGLQCVGLMRKEMEPKYEDEAVKCNSLATLRNTAERVEGFDTAILDSISPVKCLLVKLLERLELKGKKFLSYTAASDAEIGELWSKVLEVDSTLEREVSVTKKLLPTKLGLLTFLQHCCVVRHYSFQIKKCGLDTCDICKPVRMSKEFFSKLCFLPDPVPGEENHFKSFEELYGVVTTEEHRPSLHKRPKRQKTLPFSASVQHVRNVDLMLQCDECGLWRLLYSKYKLTKKERSDLQAAIEEISYTCGAQLQELELPGRLKDVYVRDISCEDSIEKLYYSAKYDPICVYCAASINSVPSDRYPQCPSCSDKPVISK